MSYKINRTDGTLLVDLIDGRLDSDTTDLILVGRNYTGYGEIFNENLIKLLENFKNSAPPPNPLDGQLWYDTSTGRLKVYTGEVWKPTDTVNVSPTQPTLVAGDIWVDNGNKQIYFSDGTPELILAGPIYTADQGKTGFDVYTIVDANGINHVISRLMIGSTPVAIFSKDTFTAASTSINTGLLAGFSFSIETGINLSTNYNNFKFHGTATEAESLLDNALNPYLPEDFLQITANNIATGTLHIKNDVGLIVGNDSDFSLRVQGNTVFARNQLNNSNFRLQVRQGVLNRDVIVVDGTTSRIGLWQQNPEYDLDVNGTVRITGNLLVQGSTTNLDVANLRVEDKVIELAITADSTELDNTSLDGAGIIIRGANGSKEIIWQNATNSFTSNVNFDLAANLAYKINGFSILTSTTLGASVTSAVGLTQIGTLQALDVDNINLNNATITTTSPLIITSSGDITVSSNRKISGVGSPTIADTDSFVVTKGFANELFERQDIWLTLDITGLSNAQIALVLEDTIPATTKYIGAYARVHCTAYSGTYTYNANDGVTKTFVAVDKNGIENQSVVQDFSFSNVTDSVTLSVTRSLKRFVINGSNQWQFDAELVSSV
jgi:hypothetical protein